MISSRYGARWRFRFSGRTSSWIRTRFTSQNHPAPTRCFSSRPRSDTVSLPPSWSEARALGMETLVEVHSAAELESLRGLDIPLIGINNRDLVTFSTDIALSASLAPYLPPGSLGVSESGIRTGEDIGRLSRAGIHAFLIGEHFMSSKDPGRALAELLRGAGETPE
jgi:hypothetical protein